MARLYADENFPLQVVEHLRGLGHDVLTTLEAEQADRSVPDDEVLDFASRHERVLLTLNRWDFVALHRSNAEHAGIIVCSVDVDTQRQAERIHEAIQTAGDIAGKLLRVNLPST